MLQKKLLSEELDSLKEIQSLYGNHIFELGKLEYQKNSLLQKLSQIEDEISLCFRDLKSIEEKDEDFQQKLREKYGYVDIDTTTGEITSL